MSERAYVESPVETRYAGDTVAASEPGMKRATEMLATATIELEEVVSSLHSRLQPVLQTERDGAARMELQQKADRPHSALTINIEEQADSVRHSTRRIREMLALLDV